MHGALPTVQRATHWSIKVGQIFCQDNIQQQIKTNKESSLRL